MKRILIPLLVLFASTASQAVKTGDSAPDFSLKGIDLKTKKERTFKLSDYRGKIVVLEWLNHGCPYVKKHYDASHHNMQNLQKKYTGRDVVWLSVVSSAPGEQGYYEKTSEALTDAEKKGSHATAVLLDPTGEVGRKYGATNTPNMFIVGKSEKLIYQGAIDSERSTRTSDIDKATNYVAEALDATLNGKSIAHATTQPYGCGVKYAD